MPNIERKPMKVLLAKTRQTTDLEAKVTRQQETG
jgi:hypothetical protein